MKIALIGFGFVGEIHLKKLLQMGFVDIYVCDIDEERLRLAREKYGLRSFPSHKDIVHICDAAIIATPSKTHYEIAKDFIMEGKSVFVEKPLTTDYQTAKEIVELAEKKSVTLQVGHVERFNPVYNFVKPFVKLPGYIKSERLGSFPGRGLDTDVVFDVMIHDIDTVVSFLPDPEVQKVSAIGIPVLTDKPDIANARIVFKVGCIAEFIASRVAVRKFRKMRIFQPGTYISANFLEKKVEVYRRVNGKIDTIYEELEGDAISDEIENFIKSVVEGYEPIVSGEEALKSIKIAELVRESLILMEENSIG